MSQKRRVIFLHPNSIIFMTFHFVQWNFNPINWTSLESYECNELFCTNSATSIKFNGNVIKNVGENSTSFLENNRSRMNNSTILICTIFHEEKK